MNRINQLFQRKSSGIISLYFCAGFPSLENTVSTIQAMQDEGIDMVEIGIPFSDPMADGPIIQSAATKSLKNGMTLTTLFEQLKDIRETITMPLILMGYLNVIYQYGFEKFCQSCKSCGIDGAIIPDLPFEVYIRDYKPLADKYDIHIIMLITPETSEQRIHLIDQYTDGFIYEVSTDATTGTQEKYSQDTIDYFTHITKMNLRNPTLIGFGVSNKATFNAAQQYAAGTIIGSKFVRLLTECTTAKEALIKLKETLQK